MVNFILMEDEILKALNNKNITYADILNCNDEVKLLSYIDIINRAVEKFNINFSIEKILNNEFLVLGYNDYKLIITLYYLELLEVA
ncbi:MAG: hypothetical protein KH200_17605 [Clostridium sp.]|uniref:hypothetical protein n=1 Tax=Clostridium TaxID=1485 RepID=UPI0012B6D69E|nr:MULTISPECIES: hypothetical protein [Clostridium]MBS6889683.1 hypothetical protein [Clostridium sp.]